MEFLTDRTWKQIKSVVDVKNLTHGITHLPPHGQRFHTLAGDRTAEALKQAITPTGRGTSFTPGAHRHGRHGLLSSIS